MPRLDIAPSSDSVRSDAELVREINTEHGHVETYKRNTIQHAIRCGELLLEMKRRVGHGNWLAWVDEHFQASERNYMEIAKTAEGCRFRRGHHDALGAESTHIAAPGEGDPTRDRERADGQVARGKPGREPG